jgi:PTH1 family peptidyl-tRNA hydrolase
MCVIPGESVMKLIVGLGNPGSKYQATRHNIGFRVLDELAQKLGVQPRPKSSLRCEIAEAQLDDEKLLLVWPQTFMNLSGQSVQPIRDFYKLTNADLLVVCDDFNLPLGKLRFRKSGSSGGQKGLEDIIRRFGSDDFCRLRIGVGAPPAGYDVTNFVLGKFSKQEQPEIDIAVVRSVDGVAAWVKRGISAAMAEFNG